MKKHPFTVSAVLACIGMNLLLCLNAPAQAGHESYWRHSPDFNVSGKPLTITDDGSWITDETLSKADALLQSALTETLPDAIRGRITALLGGISRCQEIRSGTVTTGDS